MDKLKDSANALTCHAFLTRDRREEQPSSKATSATKTSQVFSGKCKLQNRHIICKSLLTLVILALCKQEASSLQISQVKVPKTPKNHIDSQLAVGDVPLLDQSHQLLPSAEALTSVVTSNDGYHKQHETEEDATRSEAALEPPTSGTAEPQIGNHLNSVDSKLRIIRIVAPDAVENGTQNVTLDCMFKFDRKLDQRLTIKWFFNDEVEPIYQWIPELNKRVYSDKYERFLDKTYEVSEDVDYMLQAYRFLQRQEQLTSAASSSAFPDEADLGGHLESDGGYNMEASSSSSAATVASRRLLAGRLSKLAKLGGRQSRQLIESLRSVLQMDQQLEFSRYRALRLIRPTTNMSGRYTCSVTSLDGDDFRTTKLVVYERPKSLSFNVSRTTDTESGRLQYNLTCQAHRVFPRPSLALFRYRAGPLESQGNSIDPPPASSTVNLQQGSFIHRRPKLAATLLRQEPLASSTQVSIIGQRSGGTNNKWSQPNDWPILEPVDKSTGGNDIKPHSDSEPEIGKAATDIISEQPSYEIVTWTLVDEASLSSNVVSQFECLLTIEGTEFEQRQSLSLQRGWHVNSAALESRHALVGLFGALASLLCLVLALVSSMLIFKLLRRSHAKNRRVHHQSASSDKDDSGNRYVAAGGIATLSSAISTTNASDSNNNNNYSASHSSTNSPQVSTTQTVTSHSSLPDSTVEQQSHQSAMLAGVKRTTMLINGGDYRDESEADGVYRVPASEVKFGTRYFVEPPGSRLYYGPASMAALPGTTNNFKQASPMISASPYNHQSTLLRHQSKQVESPPTLSHHEYISSASKPLYC